jgi:hypothetical protein
MQAPAVMPNRTSESFPGVAPSTAATARTGEKIVTAFFDRAQAANAAFLDLRNAGFDASSITVAANESVARKDLAMTEHSKAPEGAAAGAAVGVGVGAIAGALAIAGSVLLPGIGWVAGPIVGALAGAGAAGTAGGLVGALVGSGLPEHEARVVEDSVRKGGVVLAVHAWPNQTNQAREILKQHGGRALSRS